MNGQSQPGTKGYVPSNIARGNFVPSAQYGQEYAALSSADVKRANEAVARTTKEILSNVSQINETYEELNKRIQKSTTGLLEFKKEQQLSGEALKEHNNYYNKLIKAQGNLTSAQVAFNEEANKAKPDNEKLLELYKQQVEKLNYAEGLASSINQHKALEVETQNMINEAMSDAEGSTERMEAAQEKVLKLKKEIAEIEQFSTNQTEQTTKELDRGLEVIKRQKKESKGLADVIADINNTLGTITSNVLKIFDGFSISKQIHNWSSDLSEFTQMTYDLANVWGTDYSSNFNNFKNTLIEELTSEGNVFNFEQINTAMKDLTKFSFDSFDTMQSMAKDLTFAKEYMGMSNETLVEMYSTQLRANDDTFLRKQLSTIVSLQKSGIQISEDQLNAYAKSSMTLTDAMTAMGMSYDDVAEFNSKLTEMMAAADAKYGAGAGEQLKNQIESIVKGGYDSVAQLGPTAVNGFRQALKTGDPMTLLNSIMNSEGANVYGRLYAGGPSDATVVMGSGGLNFGGLDPGFYRDYKQNETEMLSLTKSLEENAKDSTVLEEKIADIVERYDDKTEEMNALMTERLKSDWFTVSTQDAWKQSFETHMSAITTQLGVIIGIVSLLGLFSKNPLGALGAVAGVKGATSLLGGTGFGGKLLGAGSTLGGTSGISATSYGNGLLEPVSTLAGRAGLLWTGYDAFSGGLHGITDSKGNQIMGSGFGTGVVSAFSGTGVANNTFDNVAGGGLNGLAKGALIGSFFGPVGTVIGGVIGGIGGLISGWWKDDQRKKAKEEEDRKKTIALNKEIAEKAGSASSSLKTIRDAALQTRYDDYRSGPVAVGAASPGIPVSAFKAQTPMGAELGVGGTYKGIDIDGWTVTSEYDPDRAPIWIEKENRWTTKGHEAIDVAHPAGIGHPIGAAYDGTVKKVVTGNSATGSVANYVQIEHPSIGKTMQYYHLSKAADGLEVGSTVKAGQVIGYQGSSGNATGPHLHYNIVGGGDPTPYLTSAIFNPNKDSYSDITPGTNSTTSDVEFTAGIKRRAAKAVMPGATPGIKVGGVGSSSKESQIQEFRSSSIEGKLDMLNKTLLSMQAKQDKQDEIINALTATPIYDYGI